MTARPLLMIKPLVRGVAAALRDPATQALIGLTFAIILVASLVYMLTEGWGLLDALFFSVATISTVGYGDLVPVSATGRIFTIVFIFVGIGVFVVTAASIAEHVIRYARAARDRDGDGA